MKAIFFDLGNTLVDYHQGGITDEEKDFLGLRNMSLALARWNTPLSVDELDRVFYSPWMRALRVRSRRTSEYPVTELLARVLPEPATTPRRMRRLLSLFHEPFVRFAVATPGAVEVLTTLRRKGLRVGLISNTPVPGYCHDLTLDRLGLLQLLETRLYSYDVGVRKPSPRLFELAINRLKVAPSEAVMVGDSRQLDIEPALCLGIGAVQYQPVPDRSLRGQQRTISTFANLADLFPPNLGISCSGLM